MRPPILTIKRQEIECEEAWRAAVEHEIVESWFAPAIDSNNFAVQDRVGR